MMEAFTLSTWSASKFKRSMMLIMTTSMLYASYQNKVSILYILSSSFFFIDSPAHHLFCRFSSGNILISGSDDSLIKIWDLRERGTAKGLLHGHGHGITSLASKGDGVHVLSNSKDQTIKLWDLRVMGDASPSNVDAFSHDEDFDYRFDTPSTSSRRRPGGRSRRPSRRSNDISLMTMVGHQVSRTLIRATFSPPDLTGGRYVYSGSSSGGVYVWDTMAAAAATEELDPMDVLDFHREPVRSLDFHPHLPLLVSSSWDRTIGLWTHQGDDRTAGADDH